MTTKLTTPEIPTTKELTVILVDDETKAKTTAKMVESIALTTVAQLPLAVGALAEIKERHAEVKAKLDAFIKPLMKTVGELRAFFKPALDSLAGSEASLKAKVIYLNVSSEKQRRKLLNASKLEEADKHIVPKISGFSISEKTVWEVSGSELFIRWCIANNRLELLAPNEKEVKKLPEPLNEDDHIPGLSYKTKRTASVTPSKVKRSK